ncbi:Proline-rich protein [Minicystis rosea]|nr:Proline-rich protein [Minicystis rosea]
MADEAAEPEVEGDEVEEEDEPIAFKPHAMFPRDDDGPETRDIVWIQLLRVMPDGTVQTCPDQFQAADLPNWGEVYRRFGGGKYRAKGRNAKMQWQAESPGGNDWIVFDGASRPFAVNPVEMPSAPTSAAPAVPAAAPPTPPVQSGPTLAEAIVALGGVLSSVATAMINRPAPPPPPAPDNTLAVAMMQNMAAQSAASTKATSDVLVALLSKDNKQDNSSLVAVLNASAETTRAQAAAQNTLLTAVLTQKQPGLADLAEVLTKLGRGAPQPTSGIKDTIETIKAVREISGPAQVAGGGSELGEVTSLVTSLAALDKGGTKEKETEKEQPPKPRKNRIVMRTAMGLIEVVDPSPELLRQLAAPAPALALGPAPVIAAPAPAPPVPAPARPTPTVPIPQPSVAATPAAPSLAAVPPAPSTVTAALPAPLSDDEELAQLAAKLRSDPSKSVRLAQLLRDAPAEPAEAVAAPAPEAPPQDRRARPRRRPGANVTPPHAVAPPHEVEPPHEATPTPSEPTSTSVAMHESASTSAPPHEAAAQEPLAPPSPPPPEAPVPAPPPPLQAEPQAGARTIVVGGIEATVVDAGEAPPEPIRLPQSFEVPPPEATPGISDEVMAKLTQMKADEIESLVRKKIGPKADGIAEAIRALPREALPFALKMFPPDALRALAAGSL